jgi:hypothetical protein
MPENPDKYYGPGHRGLTIISMPSAGLIAVSDYPMTHEDLLSTEITDEEMRELYGDYYGDDIDMWDRSDFQNLADGYLSRAKVSGGRASVYFWQAKYASMFSAPKVRDLAGQIAAKLKELGHGFEVMEMSVPTTDFDGDVASFPQRKHYFRVRPGGVLESIKKDEYMSGGASAKAPKAPMPVVRKFFVIDGERFTMDEIDRRRKELHLKGAKFVDPVLCAIDEKEHPELKGYRPANCPSPGGAPATMKPGAWVARRGPEDWAGVPYHRLTSEGMGFRGWLAESEDLSSWMGASVVVGPDGSPMPVHHGTGYDFSSFRSDPEEFGDRVWSGDPGAGFVGSFFTEDPGIAGVYARRSASMAGEGGRPRVRSVYLRIVNPRRFLTLSQLHRDMRQFATEEGLDGVSHGVRAQSAKALAAAYKRRLEGDGYDGITFKEGAPGSTASDKARVWLPFSASQIKEVG